jgi:hypothetical protein
MIGVTEAVEFGKYQFYFCPRPCWRRGNERSDRLAVISDGRAMDHADVLYVLREALRVQDSIRDNNLNTMKRLTDGQVKLGVARQEHYACSQR